MAETRTDPLANSVDTLAKAVEKLRDRLERGIPAAAPASQEALLAAQRFRDILRGLELRLPLALTAEAASASEIKLTWSVDEPDLAPTKLLRCEGENCTAFKEIKALKSEDRSHADSGLSGNKTYRYKLTAQTPGGEESFAIAEAKTKA